MLSVNGYATGIRGLHMRERITPLLSRPLLQEMTAPDSTHVGVL